MPNDFHTHTDAAGTHAAATQPFSWRQGIWRHKSGGGPFCVGVGGRKRGSEGGVHTSHICHQNHRLSEGAGEAMNDSFVTEASLWFAKKKILKNQMFQLFALPTGKTSVKLDFELWNSLPFSMSSQYSALFVSCRSSGYQRLTSLPLEEVFPPFSHTPPRVNASVLAHLQPKTYPYPFHILTAPPPPRERVSRWTQGRSLTEPWMLFGCHTFPKRLAAAPIVAAEGALCRWSSRPPAVALPSDGFILVRECVLDNG